ncbi:MAG: hypothetical protein H7039_24425 [Bryobacteraceae bacterium]|nr:hypothetical protein [Bryobacteraceae bacterium]
MNLGAEPKKLAMLGGLLLVAVLVLVFNGGTGSGGSTASTGQTSSPSVTPAPGGVPAGAPGPARESAAARSRSRTTSEFRPSFREPKGQEARDPMSIDPTLRLDLLAKLQTVEVSGSRRSLFDFSQPPPPKPDPVKVAIGKPVPSPIVPITPDVPPAELKPTKPQPPPVPLKFYGYVNPAGRAQKRAFFVEGEEIHIVREGELVKRRYKIVRIGVNSVIVEDINFPDSPQTLPLEEQPG